MTTNTSFILPEQVLFAVSNGNNIVRAYREYLGYSLEEFSATSGLAIEEIKKIEAGHRFEKGYRSRIARALGLPDQVFDDAQVVSTAA